MNKPLPTPPRQDDDLAKGLDALTLAGKGRAEKGLPDPPATPIRQPARQSIFIGGFSPELLALNGALDNNRRPPLVPRASAARTAARPEEKVQAPPPKEISIPFPIPISIPSTSKQSLTMQYALRSVRPGTPTKGTLAPPFVTAPPPPQLDPIVSPKAASRPSLSPVPGRSQPTVNVTPSKPRAVSVPLSPATSTASSPGKDKTQCSATTKAGQRCSREVKLPGTHLHLDPTPILYCYQHRDAMIDTQQTGFYVRKAGTADRFVKFSHYIPKYLQKDTQLALRVEMEKATSSADEPGYIYTFEIRDPKQRDVIQLKVGRAVNLVKRLDQWDKQCSSKEQIPRGWWPGVLEDNETAGSLLKGNMKAGKPGPLCHRVERLVHIELADLALHAPYLNPGWSSNTSGSSRGSPKKSIVRCPDCGAIHREIFTFARPEKGKYKGREWDLIVKPVIEKWGRFVEEYYS